MNNFRKNNFIALISEVCYIMTISFVIITLSFSTQTTATTNQDLNLFSEKQANLTQELVPKSHTEQLSVSNKKSPQSQSSSRSGRMLDLDHLAGDIGKEEKLAKERSLSGQRQSRILSDDGLVLASATNGKIKTSLTDGTSERSRKANGNNNSNKKKMSIKGFIPIISLDNGKDGKHLENAMESLTSQNDDDEDNNNSNDDNSNDQSNSPYAASQTKEQLLSGYGGQTSIGHATFGVQPTGGVNEQQQQLWQQYSSNNNNNNNNNNNYDQQETGRAKKLLGSNGLLSGLTTPGKRFVSSLVPSMPVLGHPGQLQAPMNLPQINQQQQQHSTDYSSTGECMCVPFYQCKGGYLSEAQLLKSSGSLSHLLDNNQHQNNPLLHGYQQPQFALGHQVPRSLNFNTPQQVNAIKDLSYSNQNQQQISNMMPQINNQMDSSNQQQTNQNLEQQQQQNVNDLIYEQLRKSIDSNNLEQQLLLQNQQLQPSYISVDERSKDGHKQQQTESVNSTAINNSETSNDGTQERSLLNPLGRRQSSFSQQKSCGIMRICCKIPPSMINPNRFGYQIQQAPPLSNHNARFVNNNRPLNHQTNQYQMLQPASSSHQYHQTTANSLGAVNSNNFMDQFINNQQDYLGSTTSHIPTSLQQHQQLSSSQSNYLQQANNINHRPPQAPLAGAGFMAGRCGIRSTMGISGRVQNSQPMPGSESTAEFGEFPSHVAILKKLSPGDSMFVCSAVLISNQWIATAAHCVRKHRPEELKVRLGEWDVNRDDEFYPFVETSIRDIVLHPDFQPSSLINDLALLRLEQPVDGSQMPHITPACLPTTSEEQFNNQRCWVAGWGKDAFGQQGTFQSVLKKVDLPIVRRQDCENALRFETKLGKFFRLHSSAICAGGERGKDACEGDGGAGLYCIDPESGLTKVAGLVSWGVGCGQRGVPGVYTNLANLSPWIEQFIASSGEENLYTDRNSNGAENSFKNIISERSNQHVANSTMLYQELQDKTITITNNSTVLPAATTEDVESRAG